MGGENPRSAQSLRLCSFGKVPPVDLITWSPSASLSALETLFLKVLLSPSRYRICTLHVVEEEGQASRPRASF